MLRARLFVVLFVLLLAISAVGYAQEFRSIEITSWASGFESASACTTMVNYADSCNLNCVIPEIRLRCDAYYTSSIEPPGTGVVPSPPGFDSLADLISKAHPLGIEVNPWLVTWRIWTTVTGPPHMSPIEHIW
ncbi:MAG TPA: family 10 glycosylhydrolase, partial [Armatimonadota bacterium]|nr:family 10 glycosylhydrolase [Armatimonadota bacterium]